MSEPTRKPPNVAKIGGYLVLIGAFTIFGFAWVGGIMSMQGHPLTVQNPTEVLALRERIVDQLRENQKYAALEQVFPGRFYELSLDLSLESEGEFNEIVMQFSQAHRDVANDIAALIQQVSDEDARKIIEAKSALLLEMEQNAGGADCAYYFSMQSNLQHKQLQPVWGLEPYYADRSSFYELLFRIAKSIEDGSAEHGSGGGANWHAFNDNARNELPEVTTILFNFSDLYNPQQCASSRLYTDFILDQTGSEGNRLRVDRATSIAGMW